MSILIGAIATHDASVILSHAISQLGQQTYHLSYGYAQGHQVTIEHPNRASELNASAAVGLLDLSLYPHNNSPIAFRERLLLAVLGHIENLAQLVSKLEALGYAQNLQRKEDVVAALIDWHNRKHRNLRLALQLTMQEIIGYFACCVVEAEQEDCLLCASKGPLLYIAQTPNGCYFSNEPNLIREHAALLVQLDNLEIAELTPHKVSCYGANAELLRKDPVPAHMAGHFAHHMLADIMGQPLIMAQLINHYLDNQLAQFLNQTGSSHRYQRVLMLASGSSHHATAIAQYWIEQLAGIPVRVEFASEFRYRQQTLFEPDTLVIAVSQSGETADTVAALRLAKQIGYTETLLVSNQNTSTLGKLCKYHLGQFAGKEIGATSTKTFSTQLLCLYFVALKLAEGRQHFSSAAIAELNQLPRAIAETLQLSPQLKLWARSLAQLENVFLIGRNIQLPVALEAAQKMKEVCYLHAEGYPTGEIKHGPVTLINQNIPVLACLPWDQYADKMLANLQEVKARQGEIYLLSDVELNSSEHFHYIKMPRKLPLLNPILYSITFQLLSYFTALSRGNNIDTPRNLSKTLDKE
ncbi:isomerizing glutamine--fructose-6-phosphate transaminase [Chitinibacter fontanus]|uniref:Glutamine--fructose-6-phosphate aminotransferase [isomerizing] n=1 Tax=Chitinibacter fontanus TaxID=1737446 RepID=A0A7D5Z808_9NEIS|nr:isomerizing glutamine--fructose-6-phosphate transaminase [Chitinibacter fontanus]QLI82363.1 isomerizing glutamine--fructose-6-phosphate transaminase [Chitinibacter fontanus]